MDNEGSPLHRLLDESLSMELYLSEVELEAVKNIVYYCDDCNAYHVKPTVQQHEFLKALNAPWEEGEVV